MISTISNLTETTAAGDTGHNLLHQDVNKAVNRVEAEIVAGIRLQSYTDSMGEGTNGVTPWPTFFSKLTGVTVLQRGKGGQTSAQVLARMQADFASDPSLKNNATIIEVGRNDSDLSQAKTNIVAMITLLGHSRYVVKTVTNSATEVKDSTAYNAIKAFNTDLLATYGIHCYDSRARQVAGYNPQSPADVEAHTNDVTPPSLRTTLPFTNTQDVLHRNSAGMLLDAVGLLDFLPVLAPALVRARNTGGSILASCSNSPVFSGISRFIGDAEGGRDILQISDKNGEHMLRFLADGRTLYGKGPMYLTTEGTLVFSVQKSTGAETVLEFNEFGITPQKPVFSATLNNPSIGFGDVSSPALGKITAFYDDSYQNGAFNGRLMTAVREKQSDNSYVLKYYFLELGAVAPGQDA